MNKTYKGNVDSLPGIPCKNCVEKDKQILDLRNEIRKANEYSDDLFSQKCELNDEISGLKQESEHNWLNWKNAEIEIKDLQTKLAEKDRQIADLTIKLDGQYEINGYLAQESIDREKKIEEIKTQLECNALLLIEINRQADGEIADLKAKLAAETKRADELQEKINKMLKHFPDTVSGIINAMEANDGK